MIYYLGIGSNLGNREQTIRESLRLLGEQAGEQLDVASFVYTEPEGFVSEHPFCNTVAVYRTPLAPMEMLRVTQMIEQRLGRTEKTILAPDGTSIYADREIDIDILRAFDGQGREVFLCTPQLTLPHPRQHEREFVQRPMRELAKRHSVMFTKMHGLGNDYIYLDCCTHDMHEVLAHASALAPVWCDRHTGIGADGLVFILLDEDADLRMRIFNADGSEAEMCGNASRCVGLYAVRHGLVKAPMFRLATNSGVREINVQSEEAISVTMGKVNYETTHEIDGREYICLNVGNPHAVTILTEQEALTRELVHSVGPQIETHRLFPQRTNVEFAVVLDRHHVCMRVWERGSGETQACGTGATAAAAACIRAGLCDSPVDVTLLGGTLRIDWDGNTAVMTGPATEVFTGTTPVFCL